jgi:hypothetical protein
MNTTTQQLEFRNWNQLLAKANPTTPARQSHEVCFQMSSMPPVNKPTIALVQMEFPFVERFND